jgi:hypothetical protein
MIITAKKIDAILHRRIFPFRSLLWRSKSSEITNTMIRIPERRVFCCLSVRELIIIVLLVDQMDERAMLSK